MDGPDPFAAARLGPVALRNRILPSEFLSPRLNRRTDRWGGSLENRARFPRENPIW
jgi:2,4-dienoyl-CoA reductase-like NADH-dependent reductase (Old Yellow Enzyme family)